MGFEDHHRGLADARSQMVEKASQLGPATLIVALKGLEELRMLLGETSIAASNVADALGGGVPTDAAKGEPASRYPDGIADQLVAAIADATQQTHHLRQHLARAQSRIA